MLIFCSCALSSTSHPRRPSSLAPDYFRFLGMLTQSSLEVQFPPSLGSYNIDEAALHKKHRPVLFSGCMH